MEDRFPEQSKSDLTSLGDQKNGDRMIKQLLNSVIAKYRDLSMSRKSIIDLLVTDKSRYFAQPRSIIVNYFIIISWPCLTRTGNYRIHEFD